MELIELRRERFDRIRHGPVAIVTDCGAFEITGPGALECLQGLSTNDLAKPGPGSLVYGALLTPKGMIVADHWAFRLEDRFVLVTDPPGRAPSAEAFRRQLPPRLARVSDRSDEWRALWLAGSEIDSKLSLEARWPKEEGAALHQDGDDGLLVGRGRRRAPFRYLAVGPAGRIEAVVDSLVEAGAIRGTAEDLAALRVLAGWPTLGREIDQRTMPAEVGFEDLEGVSYTKGCYVGQETVARVHFRGHPNWILRGIRFGADTTIESEIGQDGRPMIRVGTALRFESGAGVGLALVRREIEPDTVVPTPSGAVAVVGLPLADG
jgi:folate-binding protein YgfZ